MNYYLRGMKSELFNIEVFWRTIFAAMWQSAVLTLIIFGTQ